MIDSFNLINLRW